MWYFAASDECLRYDDGRKIKVGHTHKVKGAPVLCEHGLHASNSVIEALSYAPGAILFQVELGGKIAHGDDKSCATERKYLARLDAEQILRTFARKCALDVAHLWACPTIVREYLETGDASKRDAARAAARAAAGAAAGDAARAAARAAAWAAAGAAAWAAAGDAAGAAAWAAAGAAAWAAAGDAQKAYLEKLCLDAIAAQK